MPLDKDEEIFLTMEELAKMLYLNEKALLSLMENKDCGLPYERVAEQFCFSKEKIWEWLDLQVNQNKYSETLLDNLSKGEMGKAIPIAPLLHENQIVIDLKAKNKKDLLEELVEHAKSTGVVKNASVLLPSLYAREEISSTALGHGIAFPHPRHSTWDMVRNSLIIIGTSSAGVDFDAMDNLPVRLFVLLSIPIPPLHIQIISHLAHIFMDMNVKENILCASNAKKVIQIIDEKEKRLMTSSGGSVI